MARFAFGDGILRAAAEHVLRYGAPPESPEKENKEVDDSITVTAAKRFLSARTAAFWRLRLQPDAAADAPSMEDPQSLSLGEVIQLSQLLSIVREPVFSDGGPVLAAAALAGDANAVLRALLPLCQPADLLPVEALALALDGKKRGKESEGEFNISGAVGDADVGAGAASVISLDKTSSEKKSSDTEHRLRLARLRAEASNTEYRKMVRDVDSARIGTTKGLSSIGIELKNMNHMLAMAFNLVFTCGSVFAAVYFVMGRAGYGDDSAVPILSATASAIILLLVETTLYMIRSDVMEEKVPTDPDASRRKRGHKLSVLSAEPSYRRRGEDMLLPAVQTIVVGPGSATSSNSIDDGETKKSR